MTDLASRHDTREDLHSTKDAFPLAALIALALSGFITILTEALPAGLLPQISSNLSVSQASVGQMVTVYAIGSLVAAIPLTRATQNMRRRPLLAVTIAGFAFANLITAISTSYSLTMVARFLAGISAGLLWALLAGYAARMVPDAQKVARSLSLWPARPWRYRSEFPQRHFWELSLGGEPAFFS